ncbi:hypothetical protein [Mucilaginibacter paludis]|uniref:hypothetical protein n=1 Tax=Mucilaginibacter paludis TaxID=423351 RepID=UPI0001E9D9F8|nr:hypothetical protein [Mucilaginibacter paludis]
MLRFYIYLPAGTPVPSTYLTDGLAIAGNSVSSIVNFNNPIANVDTVINSVTRVNKYGLQSSGAWFISQFETAYDSNIPNISYQNLNFVWNLASTSVSNVTLNGESNGTLTGTVGTGSSGGFNPSGLLNNAAKGTLYAAGLSSLNGVKANKSNIVEAVIGGLKGGLTGAVTGLISAIIGGTSSSPQMVDLKLQSNLNLSGSFSSSSGITSTTLIIPGSQNSQNGPGYVPAYNKVLGVFNFGSNPKLTFNVARTSMAFLYGPLPFPQHLDRQTYTHTFTKSVPTVLNINPELTNNGATVQIIRQDLLIPHSSYLKYTNPQQTILNDGSASSNAPTSTYSGEENILGTEYFAVDVTNLNTLQVKFSAVGLTPGYIAPNKLQYNNAIIRYTIKVTPPNNGSPYTIIRSVKTKLN